MGELFGHEARNKTVLLVQLQMGWELCSWKNIL